MTPLQEQQMSETLNEFRAMLSEMKVLHQTTKERQEIWEKMIAETTNNNKERLDAVDRRWNNLMKIVIALVGLFLVSFVSDTISLNNRPTSEDIAKTYATEDEMRRGFGVVTDDIYDAFERKNITTHEESRELKNDTRRNLVEEFGYNSRTVKK